MKKCEKVIRFKTDTVERYEIVPYDNGGYRIELYMKSTLDSIITFDVANYTECNNFMNYIANYSFFYVVVGLDGLCKIYTSYNSLNEYLQ
jgi:hypothetical protein